MKKLALLIFVLALLAGCAPAATALPLTSTAVPPTLTASATLAPTATLVPTLTATPTLPPPPTLMPTLRPTLAPTPVVLTAIPQGKSPVLDGLLSPGEWDGALRQKFTNGGDLWLMREGDYLYLGVHENFEVPDLALASVCLAQGDTVSIYHASGSLGTAIFKRDGAEWQVTQPFKWELFNLTALTAEAQQQRQAFLQQHHWVANISQMTQTQQFEYKLLLPKGSFQLAVAYLLPPDLSRPAWWPANMADDCRQVDLLQGHGGQDSQVPLRLKFTPQNWATFNLP